MDDLQEMGLKLFLLSIHVAFFLSIVFIIWDITLQKRRFLLLGGSLFHATFINYLQKHSLFSSLFYAEG